MTDNNIRQRREHKNICAFLKAYTKNKTSYRFIKEGKTRSPDCYVPELKMLVEVKEIHDTEANRKLAQWSRIVTKIRDYINDHPRVKSVRGMYSINTPSVFKFPPSRIKYKNAADELVKAVINGDSIVNIYNIKFEIKKISDEDNGIYFGAVGGGGFVNPAGTIYQNIFNKILVANDQLAYDFKLDVHKRVLLLVNQYPLAGRIDEVIRGLGFGYEKLITLKNIDEIWIQYPAKDKESIHYLIYSKEFFKQYESGTLTVTPVNRELFQRWLYTFIEKGDEHKEKLFTGLEIFLKNKKPHEIFSDKFKRQEMVRLGEWLIENKRYQEAIWLINKFINDPDPAEPDKYTGDPEFNYHQKIISGEEPSIITTVLGHLAWVIQKLSLQKDYISSALDYTETLIKHRNYYVKNQALVPLIEISARRQWLTGYGSRPYTADYKKFHQLVFGLIDLIKKEPNLKAIARRLVHVFSYYKDLNTEEAMKVLEALQITSKSAGLFVYFGIYRRRHYKDMPLEFDGKKLRERLVDIIKRSGELEKRFHAEFVWIFRDILEKSPEEFNELKEYFDMLLELPYERNLYHSIQYFLQKWIEKKPKECLLWFEKMLSNIVQEARNKERIDIWIDSTEEILTFVAKTEPKKLVRYMDQLVKLWNKGAFIGDIRTLFTTYKYIPITKQKDETKEIFQKLYKSMKQVNPKLKEVDWQD